MTPEAFFRFCDAAYQRRISVDTFKQKCSEFKLGLVRSQVERLAYVFNEDMDGYITYTEYQHALEAFNCQGEQHFVGQGPGGQGYVPFE